MFTNEEPLLMGTVASNARWLAALCVAAVALSLPAASQGRTSYCSASGDLCYGAFGAGATVRLRILLFAQYFRQYKLCVRGPDGKSDCRRFGIFKETHGFYGSSVKWASHFPFRGPGRYRATWDWGGGPVEPAITFTAGPSIHVAPKAVRAGGSVRVYGLAGGCRRGNLMTLMSKAFAHVHDFAGLPAVYTGVAADDRYSVRIHVPSSRPPGLYAISARCGGGNFGVHATVRVTRSP